MMRFGTVLTLSLAVAAGIGLFYAKHRVQALEEELTGLQQRILADREAIHVLKAEWSFLNDPERLADLARRHLEMAPVAGAQLATIADVPEKLPLAPEALEPPADGVTAPGAEAPLPDAAPELVAAPAPTPAPVVAPPPSKPSVAAPSFDELPADVQAVLASMRSAQ
jgi:cell division protein FtsL